MLKKSVFFALLAATSAAHAVVLYDNTDQSNVFYTSSFASSADDFQFGSLGSTYNPDVTITQLEMGYRTTAATSFDMVVSFYQNMDITTPTNAPNASTTNILSGLAKTYTFNFTTTAAGSFSTTLLDLSNYGGGFTLPAVSNFSQYNHGVQVAFYNPGTTVVNTNVRALFTGSQDPATGYSYNTYGRDANANGVITADERANFGDPVNARANFYMQIVGQPVPEPMSLAPVALGALAVLRRRKRA